MEIITRVRPTYCKEKNIGKIYGEQRNNCTTPRFTRMFVLLLLLFFIIIIIIIITVELLRLNINLKKTPSIITQKIIVQFIRSYINI